MLKAKVGAIAAVQISVSVASIVFGLTISPLLEKITSPLFDTPSRAILTSILFLSLLMIIAIVIISVFAKRNEESTARANQRHEENVTQINQKLIDISNCLGLSLKFVHDPPHNGTGRIYRAFREIVEKADNEILALYVSRSGEHTKSARGRGVETIEYQIEREKYFKSLIEKLQQKADENKRFFYRRIVQFPESKDTKVNEARMGKRWFDHTEEVLEILKKQPDAGWLKKSSLFFEQSFLIVDKRYVICPMDGTDPKYDSFYVEGALIFDDPDQVFVQYLIDFFHRVDTNAVVVSKVPEDYSYSSY